VYGSPKSVPEHPPSESEKISESLRGEASDKFIEAVAEIQDLISPSGFAVGDHFTIADAAIAPFLGRWELLFRNDVGKFAEGEGKRVHEVLFLSSRANDLQVCRNTLRTSRAARVSRIVFDSVQASRGVNHVGIMLIELFRDTC